MPCPLVQFHSGPSATFGRSRQPVQRSGTTPEIATARLCRRTPRARATTSPSSSGVSAAIRKTVSSAIEPRCRPVVRGAATLAIGAASSDSATEQAAPAGGLPRDEQNLAPTDVRQDDRAGDRRQALGVLAPKALEVLPDRSTDALGGVVPRYPHRILLQDQDDLLLRTVRPQLGLPVGRVRAELPALDDREARPHALLDEGAVGIVAVVDR